MLRLNCYRYTAEVNEPQQYLSEPPYKINLMLDDLIESLGVVTLACPMFWNNKRFKNESVTN
jgi:hypothetical protein